MLLCWSLVFRWDVENVWHLKYFNEGCEVEEDRFALGYTLIHGKCLSHFPTAFSFP